MHPLRHPRNALFVGLIFLAIGAIYYTAPIVLGGHFDWAGGVMLLALGIAMSLMFYVLIAGSPND